VQRRVGQHDGHLVGVVGGEWAQDEPVGLDGLGVDVHMAAVSQPTTSDIHNLV